MRAPGADSIITGTLGAFTADPSYAYKILVTNEGDVEYAWALEEAAAGPFTIRKPRPFGGKIKLRLVELEKGCARRVVGQVWAEENAAVEFAWPDLRIEYRSITAAIPSFPTSIVPASRDGTWAVPLRPPGIGRVSLVDVNTRRIYGECTMPSGLLRSYNVPAADAGQTPGDVYYDAFNDACFLYDQAVALIAFLQLGERDAAAALVDALLAVQNPDGGFPFANDQSVLFEHGSGFIRIGAVAWVCYALLLADKPEFRDWFASKTTDAARNCLDFLSTYRNPRGLLNGGKGRYVGIVLDPDHVVPWWSTEHNIDAWWCFDLAAELYGDAGYRAAADEDQGGARNRRLERGEGDILARWTLRRGPQHAGRATCARHDELGRVRARPLGQIAGDGDRDRPDVPALLRDRCADGAVGIHDLHSRGRLSGGNRARAPGTRAASARSSPFAPRTPHGPTLSWRRWCKPRIPTAPIPTRCGRTRSTKSTPSRP